MGAAWRWATWTPPTSRQHTSPQTPVARSCPSTTGSRRNIGSPCQVDDCAAALAWLRDQADELGRRPAAHRCLRRQCRGRDRRESCPAARVTIAAPCAGQADPGVSHAGRPVIGAADHAGRPCRHLEPRRECPGMAGLPGARRRIDETPPDGAVPARAESLPACRRPTSRWAASTSWPPRPSTMPGRLVTSGVATELHVYPGAYHAFDAMAPGLGAWDRPRGPAASGR